MDEDEPSIQFYKVKTNNFPFPFPFLSLIPNVSLVCPVNERVKSE